MSKQNVIPLPDAVQETTNWRQLAMQKLGPEDYVTAFTIPMVDLTQIIEENAVSVRAYLAMTNGGEKKLLLVGVDANGQDMIDYENGWCVYDFTNPCPPSCDTTSPLSSNS